MQSFREANMDISRSLRFPSLNPNWLPSLIIWMLLMMGIVTTPLAIGYLVRVVRNVARGNEFLPSYADKSQLYKDGLRCMAAGFILVLPFIAAIVVNEFCLGMLQSGDNSAVTLLAMVGQTVLGKILQSVYLGVVVFITPLAMMCVAYSPNWYAGFDFGLMRRLVKNNLFDYAFTVLVAYAVSSLSGFGFFVFFVGILISVPYASFCIAHMYGTFLRQCIPQDNV